MTLQDISVGMFQELWKINKSEIDVEEKMTEMVAVLSNKTTNEVDSMTIPEFNVLAKQVQDILSEPLPNNKPPKKLCGYSICYEPGKLTRGQYITVLHFMKGDIIENCHFILASLALDDDGKHPSDQHNSIAEAMQAAKLVDIYPACLFFCDLFKVSMESLQSFLVKELMEKGAKPATAIQAISDLMSGLDGFTMLSKSQTLKE